jgi:tRNA pseudouridine13 synthase
MKLKQEPEDFQVEELTDVVAKRKGAFAYYRLEKRGWTTLDAVATIRRRWKTDSRRISFGGLKDRHALTSQFLTIHHGPQRGLKQQGIFLKYLGQLNRPFTSQDIRANRFHITLRNLSSVEASKAQHVLEEVRQWGMPNYFDDQRFGSVSPEGRFVAKAIVLGCYEEALQLALAEPYEHDRAAQKKEKAFLRSHWGDWALCKSRLARGPTRAIVDHLTSHPDDFLGALARLGPEVRSLYFAAYQSYLWNRLLASWLRQQFRPDQLVSIPLRLGKYPTHREADSAQHRALTDLSLPLPTARGVLDAGAPETALLDAVLAEEGMQRAQLKVKGVREMFFSKGERRGFFLLTDLMDETGVDERNPGRRKLTLACDLPRGSYATLIVKRITV